jgi:hypothetical protein
MRAVRAQVRAAIHAGRPPTFTQELWCDYKSHFSGAQHGKCGYCERIVTSEPAAVDHYAPKGPIGDLVAEGRERDSSTNVKGRKVKRATPTGYWWLAYSWENWLFVCNRCNTAWKKTLFPVRENRTKPPSRASPHTPLLLNPFGPTDPVNHLCFDALGQISRRGRSALGRETIRTCGLDRESLRHARHGVAEDTHRLVGRLQLAIANNKHQRAAESAEDLALKGNVDRDHAGMVRSIVRTELKLGWTRFLGLVQRLRAMAGKSLDSIEGIVDDPGAAELDHDAVLYGAAKPR